MERKGFIGGSDAVKIMNGNWYDLWAVKTGKAEPDDLSRNLAVQMGVLTEDFNIEWFEAEHDYNLLVEHQQKEFKYTANGVPYKGTVDGIIKGGEATAIIEAKHTNAYNTISKVAEYYMPQIQLYCWLAGTEGAHLSVIFGNNKWESVYISAHEPYIHALLDACTDFWAHVESGDEPIGFDQPVTAPVNQIPIDQMIKRNASSDNHFVSAAHDYLENEDAAKAFENAKKDLKAMVADDEREVYSNAITIRRDKRGALRISKRKD